MNYDEALIALVWLWLVFTSLVVIFAVRIAAMLYHQRRIETAYRLHLAVRMGTAAREQRMEADAGRG